MRFYNGKKFIPQYFTRPIKFSRPVCAWTVANPGFFFGKKLAGMFVAKFRFHLFDGFFNYPFVIIFFGFGGFLRRLIRIRPRDFAVTAPLEKMCQRGMKFFGLQSFAIESAETE